MNDETESYILICSQLNFHGSELDPPADIVVNGNFEPHRVPVSSVEHVEYRELVIRQFRKLLVCHDVISPKNIGQMEKKFVIDVDFSFLG